MITFGQVGEDCADPDADYYMGVYADIRHITSGQDIIRPEFMAEIDSKLRARNFCVLRAPSGSGKTTLMYRYAYEQRHKLAVYRLESLEGSPSTIADCIQFLRALKPSRSSPVLLLIDAITRPEKTGWQQLLRPLLENSNFLVLATTREDEWNDLPARGLNVEYVFPWLSEETAASFHEMLKVNGQLHADYPDWREAYEASKTHGEALFMEYTHILTKGQRIEDVLREQVHRVQAQPAPIGAIQTQLLRLICTAHAYGGRIPAVMLPPMMDTHCEDLARHIRHLTDEHLIALQQGYYVGLHELRSRFLSEITHEEAVPPLADTVKILMVQIPIQEVASIAEFLCRSKPELFEQIASAFAVRLNREGTLCDLADVLWRLFAASEWHYASQVKAHLEEFDVPPSSISAFAVKLGLAIPEPMEMFNSELFADLLKGFDSAPARGPDRFEVILASRLDAESTALKIGASRSLPDIINCLNWLHASDPEAARRVLSQLDIDRLFSFAKEAASGLLIGVLAFHLYRIDPTSYQHALSLLGGSTGVVNMLRERYPLIAKIERETRDNLEDVIHVRFWADEPLEELGSHSTTHNKTIFLANVARRMFPDARYVRTTGMFATGHTYQLGRFQPTTKEMDVKWLQPGEDTERNRIWTHVLATHYSYNTWSTYLHHETRLRAKYSDSLIALIELLVRLTPTALGFSEALKKAVVELYKQHECIRVEGRNFLFPPDIEIDGPGTGGDGVKLVQINDPDKTLHGEIVEGRFYTLPISEANSDFHLRSYMTHADKCIELLCVIVVKNDNSELGRLRANVAGAQKALEEFAREREKIKLGADENARLYAQELAIADLLERATRYVFKPTYRRLWAQAELLLEKTQLLLDSLDALCKPSENIGVVNGNALVVDLAQELRAVIPSIGVFEHLATTVPVGETGDLSITPHQVGHLRALTLLDYFVALAEQQRTADETAKLKRIVERAQADGVVIDFGLPLRSAGKHGLEEDTFFLTLEASQLWDVFTRTTTVFKAIFTEEFEPLTKFVLLLKNDNSLIPNPAAIFRYYDKSKWRRVEALQSGGYINFCMEFGEDLKIASIHLGLSVAEEPEYIRAYKLVINALVTMSERASHIREQVKLGLVGAAEVEQVAAATVEEISGVTDFKSRLQFLREYQPASDFEEAHQLVRNFLGELAGRITQEIDSLKNLAAGNTDLQNIPFVADGFVLTTQRLAEAKLALGPGREDIQAALAGAQEADAEITIWHGRIYLALLNYFLFSKSPV